MWAYAEASRKMKLAGGPAQYENNIYASGQLSMIPLVVAAGTGWALQLFISMVFIFKKNEEPVDKNHVTKLSPSSKDDEYMCAGIESVLACE